MSLEPRVRYPYGRRLSATDVRAMIRKDFLDAEVRQRLPSFEDALICYSTVFDSFVDQNTLVAVEHSGHELDVGPLDLDVFPFLHYYLIGKSTDSRRDGGRCEFTFYVGTGPELRLGVEYDGDDFAFQPRLPTKEEEKKEIRPHFPLDHPYGASFHFDRSSEGRKVKLHIEDTRLDDLALSLYHRLRCLTSSSTSPSRRL